MGKDEEKKEKKKGNSAEDLDFVDGTDPVYRAANNGDVAALKRALAAYKTKKERWTAANGRNEDAGDNSAGSPPQHTRTHTTTLYKSTRTPSLLYIPSTTNSSPRCFPRARFRPPPTVCHAVKTTTVYISQTCASYGKANDRFDCVDVRPYLSALHVAASRGYLLMATHLLDAGAELLPDEKGTRESTTASHSFSFSTSFCHARHARHALNFVKGWKNDEESRARRFVTPLRQRWRVATRAGEGAFRS